MAEDRNEDVPKGNLFQRKENLVSDMLNGYMSTDHDKLNMAQAKDEDVGNSRGRKVRVMQVGS